MRHAAGATLWRSGGAWRCLACDPPEPRRLAAQLHHAGQRFPRGRVDRARLGLGLVGTDVAYASSVVHFCLPAAPSWGGVQFFGRMVISRHWVAQIASVLLLPGSLTRQ